MLAGDQLIAIAKKIDFLSFPLNGRHFMEKKPCFYPHKYATALWTFLAIKYVSWRELRKSAARKSPSNPGIQHCKQFYLIRYQ